MKQTSDHSNYRTLMDDVEMPERLKARIMSEVRRSRDSQAQLAEHPRRTQPISRRKFIGGAVVVGSTLALGGTAVFALTAKPNVNSPASSSGNSFALLAYADENPGDEPGKTAALNLDDFGYDSVYKVWRSDPEIDPNNADNAPDSGQRYLSITYQFNLTCTGTNVASLTYTMEGDRVLFFILTRETGSTYQEGDDPFEQDRSASFTIDYGEQHPNEVEVWRGLRASFPLEGEIANAYDSVQEEFHSGRRDVDYDRQDRLHAQLTRIYADMIAKARLHLTATFEDGSTETKTYVIAPVDDLEETMCAYHAAARARSRAEQDAGRSLPDAPELMDPPTLFTLTELA